MGNVTFKPGNMLYPLPAVLVSVTDGKGNDNVFTVAWTGTVCSDPPMVFISVRPSRYSYQMIKDTGEFVINLTTESLARATDFCGVRSGRDVDKFTEMHLTKLAADKVKAPLIKESPVRIECRVTQELELGSHVMFIAKVESVSVDDAYMDEKIPSIFPKPSRSYIHMENIIHWIRFSGPLVTVSEKITKKETPEQRNPGRRVPKRNETSYQILS